MAEMIGVSRNVRRRSGASGLVAALKRSLARLTGQSRPTGLRLDEWSDYLLRDIGLDGRVRDESDPRAQATDWLRR